MSYPLFASTPKATEELLVSELKSLGAESIKATVAGVSFRGDLATAYRVCLWSRIASRVLLVLAGFPVKSQDDLYRGVQKIDWANHFAAGGSFAVTFSSKHSQVFNNTHFGALKAKDAVVDQLRAKYGVRPSIDTDRPDIRINVHVQGEAAQLALDLSGESLHRRGYRDAAVKAPIKENLAAALLLRSGWPKIAERGGSLLDPMCGSGTLLVEGAMLAADYAPGLLRGYFGFTGWLQHDAGLWRALREEAEARKQAGLKKLPKIVGFDQSLTAVHAARSHIARAGLVWHIHVERRDIGDAAPADSWQPGLLICNPPYGERLGDEAETTALYRRFGDILKARFQGWQAAMIVSDPELGFRLGIRSQKPVTFFNGALACKLLRMDINEAAFFLPNAKSTEERLARLAETTPDGGSIAEAAPMFANRIKKNLKKLEKWAKQNRITCYRVYDADLPEYSVAVDFYQGEQSWVNVQEYEPPKTISPHKADQRLAALLAELPEALNVSREQVFLKVRKRQRHAEQYEKQGDSGHFHAISEGGCKLLVNFEDYLDTGLFLDHRPIRLQIQREAEGKRFLNLFAYTGSATVHAAVGGAKASTTVDMSNTYLNWAQRNLALNPVSGEHEFIQADCLEWLETEARQPYPREFDLIFLDPPTFSNSKRMNGVFDIQADYPRLITNAAKLLARDGVLYFSCNFRRFKFDAEALPGLDAEDITAQTIPEDFARDPKIHYCWRIRHTWQPAGQ